MARPLFEIATEISADWQDPSPAAKSYLKGMCYLLGMDDYVADLDAGTAVRMFLLYSKTWTGPVAERVKAELKSMRSANAPRNADLLQEHSFPRSEIEISHCELCSASLGTPGKFVDSFTHWGARMRMCMHCNYCICSGPYEGNGAVYLKNEAGVWLKLHGEPVAPPPPVAEVASGAKSAAVISVPRPTLRFQLKSLGRKVIRKCAKLVDRWTRRSA